MFLPDKGGFDREYGEYEFGGHESTSRVPRGAGEKKLLLHAWNYQWSLGDASWAAIDHNRGCYPQVAECGALDTFRSFSIPSEGSTLSVLVENMGRTNYGPYLRDVKGITEGIRFGAQFLYHWTIHTLPLDDLSMLEYTSVEAKQEDKLAFYKGTFQVDETADTFLELKGWNKGVAYINGFNLGRYWETLGPQKTLYIPGPLLRKGEKELVLFELHGAEEPVITLRDSAILG